MPEPTAALNALRASTADLQKGLAEEQWSDADVRAGSLCDGWTRGHVLTHIARNADAVAGVLAGVLRDELVLMYPDGRDGRNADIEAGADRPPAELLADVAESAARLDRVLGALSEADAWDHPSGGRVPGDVEPAAAWVGRRLGEVEIHRVDLGGSYIPDRWPPLLIESLLPELVDDLDRRAGAALRIEIAREGTVVQALAGRSWTVGEGAPTVVRGADWSVLAWLVGRPSVSDLDGPPDLDTWR